MLWYEEPNYAMKTYTRREQRAIDREEAHLVWHACVNFVVNACPALVLLVLFGCHFDVVLDVVVLPSDCEFVRSVGKQSNSYRYFTGRVLHRKHVISRSSRTPDSAPRTVDEM